MDQEDYQVNPGRESSRISKEQAIKGLEVIVQALESGRGAWQSLSDLHNSADPILARIPERAKTLDVYPNRGENPQVLVIERPDVPQLAQKLDAALQVLGVLKRSVPHHVFNASALYPPGPSGIVANSTGKEQIAEAPKILEELNQQQKSSFRG